MRGSQRASLVEPPGGSRTADVELGELEEGCVGEIDGVAFAAHALVHYGCGGGLATLLDSDGLATVWVTVGLSSHHSDWESNDFVDATIGGLSTSSKTGIVVGNVSFTWGCG